VRAGRVYIPDKVAFALGGVEEEEEQFPLNLGPLIHAPIMEPNPWKPACPSDVTKEVPGREVECILVYY